MNAARKLYEAKNAAGDHAASASGRGDHEKARRWSALAVEADKLARKAIEEMAK